MKLSDLTPNEKNPRILTEDRRAMLKKSLDKFGDVSGFVFNKRSGRLVCGHQKRALMPLESTITITETYEQPNEYGTTGVGFVTINGEKYKYREVDVSDSVEKAINIASNQHGGDFDIPAVAEWIEELSAEGIDLDLLGFGKDELELMLMPDTSMADLEDSAAQDPNKKFILEIELASEAEMLELSERLAGDGYLVKLK